MHLGFKLSNIRFQCFNQFEGKKNSFISKNFDEALDKQKFVLKIDPKFLKIDIANLKTSVSYFTYSETEPLCYDFEKT